MLIGQRIGPFAIEKELGSGAMGTVYRATFDRTGEHVAFKVISAAMTNNESALARFEREATILKSLKHPHIVRWVGTGKYKGMLFFAMEFINGESLDQTLTRRGRLSWEEVVTYGIQLCDALQHAHEKDVIHRDLKPSNLMIQNDGVLKLTDFGIAKNPELADLTATNTAIGTAAYMSPEQCRGERFISPKSDIYSMGIVFYELITGRKPFNAESAVDMFLQHVNGTFIRPIRIVPEMPIWLDNLVCQMLEKKPEHRPRDAATVGKALAEVLDKVSAQQSAGAVVARTKSGERVYQNDVADERDVEASKALRAVGKRKPKKSRKREPIYRQGWFVLLGCVLLLGVMGGVLLWLVSPPSMDRLYADIEKAEASGKPDDLSGAVERYLGWYASRTDPNTQRVKQLQRDIKAGLKEKVLYNLKERGGFLANRKELKPGFDALTAESEGRIADARRYWREFVDKFKDEPKPDEQAWAWLGEKRLRELDELPARDQALRKRLEDDRIRGVDTQGESVPEQRLLRAYRLDAVGDRIGARDEFRALAKDIEKEFAQRNWAMLAGYKANQLEEAVPPRKGGNAAAEDKNERREFYRQKADEARTLYASADQTQHRKGQLIAQELNFLFREDIDTEWKRMAGEMERISKLRP